MPLGMFYVFGQPPRRVGDAWPIALLLFWRHRANIRAACSRAASDASAAERQLAAARAAAPASGRIAGVSAASGQRGRTSQCAPLRRARASRSAPANAIIAPLSVQNARSREVAPAPPRVARRASQPLAQRAVGAHAAGHHEPRAARRVERRERLRDEHVDDRRLELARDVGLARLGSVAGRRACVAARTSVSTAVFRPLKLKSRSPRVEHRPRQREPRRACPRSASARQRRAAGIAAGRAASRSCRRPRRRRRRASRRAAGSGRRPPREELACGRPRRAARRTESPGAARPAAATAGGLRGDGRRRTGLPSAKAERAGDARADQQRAGEPRPLRVGDAVEVARARGPRSASTCRDQRQQAPDVVARGELGHHAAVGRVQRRPASAARARAGPRAVS